MFLVIIDIASQFCLFLLDKTFLKVHSSQSTAWCWVNRRLTECVARYMHLNFICFPVYMRYLIMLPKG